MLTVSGWLRELEYYFVIKEVRSKIAVDLHELQLVASQSIKSYAVHVILDFFDTQIDEGVAQFWIIEGAFSLRSSNI